MLQLAADHDLQPALWRAGLDRGWFTPVPAAARAIVASHLEAGHTHAALLLQHAYEDNSERLTDLLAQGDELKRALDRAGIAAVPLKGWHVVHAGWYSDPQVRLMRDLDVLVVESHADQARAVAEGLGYQTIDEAHDDYADHQLPAIARPGRLGSLELHIALVVSRWAAVLPAREVVAAGRMTTTQAVVHAIAHVQLHDEAFLLRHRPLRALHEIAVLSRSPRAGDVDWDEVRRCFDRAGASAALDAHLLMARRLFGADVPSPRSSWRPALHERLCDLELLSDRGARVYRAAAFAPRALSRSRMQNLYGNGNVWRQRLRHVTGSVKRAFDS